ncbi:MAG: glycosyltransferase family 4 protein [Tepidisphaeraceae bacterium]
MDNPTEPGGATPAPLHILHLTAGSDAGGISQYLLNLSTYMGERGHRITLAGEFGAWHERFGTGPWEWMQLPLKGGTLQLASAARSIRRWMAQTNVDIVHVHYRRPAMMARLGRCFWMNSAGKRPPVLFTLHLSDLNVSGPRRWLTWCGDHVHVAAEEAKSWLLQNRLASPDRISVIPHGVNVLRFPEATADDRIAARRELGIESSDIVGAYVGRLDYPKNVDWLVDLADASARSAPGAPVRILIVGAGPDDARLRSQVERLRLGERVIFLGERDPLVVYQASDLVLLPSLREGFSYVCAEAMCVGTPVLRTRTAGTSLLIQENVTGHSVAIDHDLFIQRARELLLEPSGLARLRVNAARHIRAHFTAEQQFERTIDLYRRLRGDTSD